MPIPQIKPRINHWETKLEKLIAYAENFERMAKDTNLKSFKKDLIETAKLLRKEAKFKQENPFY